MFIIYDIEVTKTGQFIGFKCNNSIKYISLLDRKNLIAFIKFIKEKNYILVGYNNYGYDNKILNYCMCHKNLKPQDIINFSNSLINKTAEVKSTEFNICVPMMQYSKVENLDVYSMMNQKKSLKLNAFLKYNYLFKDSLVTDRLEDLKKYNLEDLKLTERIFKEEFQEEYQLNLYLSDYLELGEIGHKNLIISKFLKEKATYNTKFDFKSCLDKIAIDKDLKDLAVKLISNSKLTQIYTQDKILVKKGGLHFPTKDDFEKQGIQYYKECFNYDFSSFYPNIYINLLDFFSPDTKEYLKNILTERLQAKKSGDDKKNKALKLFINSVYGQLKSINEEYMFAVAILGQVLFVQLMRDNNITLSDIIELNTDGILLKNKLKYIKNISKIELEEEVFTDVYHKNSNNKTYILNSKPVVKGQLLGSNEYTDKIVFKDLSACLYNNNKIYNCFIVKRKNKDKFDQIKYYKFKNLDDIKNYRLGHNGILMAKSMFEDAIKNNILEEIIEYNYQDITPIVTVLFKNYLQEHNGYKRYIDSEFELKSTSEEVKELYNKYKDKLYLLPSDKDICIQHKEKSIHNELAFYQNQNPKNLFIVPADEFIIVELNRNELANKKIKELLADKTKKYFIFRKPIFSIKTKALKGLKYYKDLKTISINSVNEVELVGAELPEVFYKAGDEVLEAVDFVGMNQEALNEKNRLIKKKSITEKSKQVLVEEEAKVRRTHYLDDKQLKVNIAKITEFLGILDPNTVELDCYGNTQFINFPKELRPIKRDKQDKNYIQSTIYYSLTTKKAQEYMQRFFEKLNGSGYCAYYSVFNFKPEKSVYQNKIKSKKITNKTAQSTCILPMDFDDIPQEKYLEIKETFTNLNLETLDVFTGHGYQMIILLNQYCYDKDILKKFTSLLVEKGFPVDEAIIDSARIMRLPYTYNCKCLDKNSKYYGKEEPILTTVVNKTRTRYDLKDIFNRLLSLKSVEPQSKIENTLQEPEVEIIRTSEEKIKEVEVPHQKEVKNKNNKNKSKEDKIIDFIEPVPLTNNSIAKLQKLYPMLKIKELEVVIQKILSGTKEGMRNNALLFMLPYFKNYKKYSLEVIEDIFTIWGGVCIPKIEPKEIVKEVRQLHKYDNMTALYGKYTEALKEEYGIFRLGTKVFGAVQSKENKIYISNDITKNLDKMHSTTLKLYVNLLLENSNTREKIFTIKDIIKITGISQSIVYKRIKYLIKHKYIKKIINNKKNGESYQYKLDTNQINYNKMKYGYVDISKELAEKMLDELTGGEMSTYLYMTMIQRTSKDVCKLTQYQIAKNIQRVFTTISNITSSLYKKGYAIKKTFWITKDFKNKIFKQGCTYDTNYINYSKILLSKVS